MRITLDLDEDILYAAGEIARARGTTAGRVVSELRSQRAPTQAPRFMSATACRFSRGGQARRPRPTMNLVNGLREG